MLAYFKMQWIIWLRKKGHFLIALVVILSVFFGCYYNKQKSVLEHAFVMNQYNFSMKDYKNEIQLNENETYPILKSEGKKYLDRKLLISNAIKNNNIDVLLKEELISLNDFKTYASPEQDSTFLKSGGSINPYFKGKTLLNEYLVSKKMAPESTRYGYSGALLVISLLPYLTSFYGIFLISLCCYRVIGNKYEGNQYKGIKMTPLPYSKQLLADYILFIVNLISILIIFILSCLSIGYLNSKKVGINYPIIIFLKKEIQLIPAKDYILKVIVMYILVLSIVFFISSFIIKIVKNNFMTIMLSTFVIFIAFSVSKTNHLPWNKFNPFLYAQTTQVFNGRDDKKIDIDFTSILEYDDSNPNEYVWVESSFPFENVDYYQADSISSKLNLNTSFITAILSLSIFNFLLFLISIISLKKGVV